MAIAISSIARGSSLAAYRCNTNGSDSASSATGDRLSIQTAGHKLGKHEARQRAAGLLAKRGVIEIWAETQLYRLKPKK
jgi:hypothetical protein